MINLLPTETKEAMLFARRNRRLLHWAIALLLSMVTVGVIALIGQLHISRSVASYTTRVEQAREQLKVQKLEQTQKRVEDITNSLKLVLQVLSREVLFSKLIRQVGAVMPPNTVLTNLQIAKLDGGIDLDAVAINYQTATQIQINLQDQGNKLFDKADIVNITCTPTTTATAGTPPIAARYPCQVKIRALFTKNNPFLFINSTPSNGAQPR